MAPYRAPQLLADLQLLDLVELAGSTVRAAPLLNLSQPTVSRRRQRLVQELGLSASPALRQGDGACLRLLRRAAKRHRLDAGVWRVGGDGWCLDPQMGQDDLLVAPPRFAPVPLWQALVAGHLLDGALVSGHELRLVAPGLAAATGAQAVGHNCVAVPLLQLPLLLLGPAGSAAQSAAPLPPWSTVLMPPLPCCGGLATAVRQQQLRPVHLSAVPPQATAWLDALGRDGTVALATPLWQRQLQARAQQPLRAIALPKPLSLDLWLLVHRRDWSKQPALPQMAAELGTLIAQRIANP